VSTLQIDGLTAGYSQLPVIRDVSLRAEPGSIVSILGSNGSGKSTLLKAIIGLLKPMSGRVLIGGRDVTGWRPYRIVREGIGYVPQTNNVFVSLSVVENLEMGAFVRNGDIGARTEQLLESIPDLKAARNKRAGDLSVGQRNLLGLARALMLDPSAILVDEPTAGLAPANTRRIWQQLKSIAANGAAVVVVEQNVDMALEHSDHCYVLVAGQTRLDAPAASIQAGDLYELFLGSAGSSGAVSSDHEATRSK
jgi:ABC-type branched-subunit amino acid transport system ATPase component